MCSICIKKRSTGLFVPLRNCEGVKLIHRVPVHALEEAPKVLRINPWCDSVSQVRNPSFCLFTPFEALAHPLDLALDCFSPTI